MPAIQGLANVVYLAFGQPDPILGINLNDASITSIINCTNYIQEIQEQYCFGQDEVNATDVYRYFIQTLREKNQVHTLISIGGWSYRDDFNFLANFTEDEKYQWAVNVKSVIDLLDADGFDVDFEAENITTWNNVLVQTNIFHILRNVMPEGEYIIKFTIGGANALDSNPVDSRYLFYPTLLYNQSECGFAVSVIKQNWNDFDGINMMVYCEGANFNPNDGMTNNQYSINSYLNIQNANTKLVEGIQIGEQQGDCSQNESGWCVLNHNMTALIARYASVNKLRGVFYWPDYSFTEDATFYNLTYQMLFKKQPNIVYDLLNINSSD